MIFRVSQKLCTKIKAGKVGELPLDDNPFADWSCHIFTSDRTQYVILSNTPSLYSCVTFGRGVTSASQFVEQALSTIGEFLENDGQQLAASKFNAAAGGAVSFSKALNRSVTGSMNDLVQAAKWRLAEGMSPHEVGFDLNRTPLSALKYSNPSKRFASLASAGVR